MSEYEVKTMKKDIEELRKKMKISDSELVELLGKKKSEPASPELQPASRQGGRGESPEKLPTVEPKKPKEAVKPPKPPEPEKELKEPTKPEKPEKSPKPKVPKPPHGRKPILPIVITILILLIIGGGVYYWWNYLRTPEEPEPAGREPVSPGLKIPASFIEVDETKIIELEEEDVLFEKLKEVAEQEQELGKFQRILVKKIGPPAGEAGKEEDFFLSFQEIVEILYVNIPYSIASKLDLGGEHTLFLYSQEGENRLGFVIKVSEFENLIENLKSWESKMQGDMRPFFLGRVLGFPATEEFQDNIYLPAGPLRSEASEAGKDINIRYLNFPDPFSTIDYAVVSGHLIITTSRESIYKVIDKILEE